MTTTTTTTTMMMVMIVIRLLRVTENKKLSDLIQFVSSAPYLPPRLVLTFSDDIMYPIAHSCFYQLQLPTRHEDYAAFRDAVVFALQHGTAFTAE